MDETEETTGPPTRRNAPKGGIDEPTLRALVEAGLTIEQMSAEVGLGAATVKHWLRRHGLRTVRARGASLPADQVEAMRRCRHHGDTLHVRRGDGSFRCKRCRVEHVSARRRRVKQILVDEAGGRCVLCGYHRFAGALQFHHVDPDAKAFSLSAEGIARSLERARAEAKKCVLLCANCHAEVEAGIATIPIRQSEST
jgi:hypothetical protein